MSQASRENENMGEEGITGEQHRGIRQYETTGLGQPLGSTHLLPLWSEFSSVSCKFRSLEFRPVKGRFPGIVFASCLFLVTPCCDSENSLILQGDSSPHHPITLVWETQQEHKQQLLSILWDDRLLRELNRNLQRWETVSKAFVCMGAWQGAGGCFILFKRNCPFPTELGK